MDKRPRENPSDTRPLTDDAFLEVEGRRLQAAQNLSARVVDARSRESPSPPASHRHGSPLPIASSPALLILKKHKFLDDVLFVIKSYMGPPCASSSSMVCKQWRRVMRHGCLLALTPFRVVSVTVHQLETILAALCRGLQDELYPALFSNGTQGAITDVSIIKVAEHCPQLQTLVVSSTGGAITDASISRMAECCQVVSGI